MAVFKFIVPAGHKAGSCAEDGGRFAMGHALVFKGNVNGTAYVASCNGKALAVLPTADSGPDKPLLLPAKAVNAVDGREMWRAKGGAA